ncbi:MAG: sigma-70 family RNA polymerase sigma factor [Jatrophihabitans sp.]
MPRARHARHAPRPAVTRAPASAWRPAALPDLIELINDAVMSMGTQPAFNGPSAVRQPAVDTNSVKPSLLKSRRGRPLRVADNPPPDDAREQRDDNDTNIDDTNIDDTNIEAGHAETWRLVRLAQAGDGQAFGQLYDRYVDIVFRFVYFRVNDRNLAEDVTSETFLRALRRIGTISYQGRDIGAWFITIARNIVLDHMKSARHRLEMTTADVIEPKEVERSTEAAVLDTLQSEQLMVAVSRLGDEQRECVMLRFIQGLSVAETAGVMGKNDGAIKALQHRAVRKLADLVGNDMR